MMYPSIWTFLAAGGGAGEEAGHGGGHHALGFNVFFYVLLSLVVMMGFFHLARKGAGPRVPTNIFTRLAEHVYLFIEKLCISIIGPHGKTYMTFLATLWCFIFTSNILGLFMKHAATGNLGVNAGMALVTVAYIQYAGIKSNGLVGHLKHFAGPAGIPIFISILLFLVEIVSELAKIGSLTLRLFANIEGGHLVVKNISDLMSGSLAGIPLGGVLLPIKLLSAILQAFIWVMLTSVYLNIVTHHEEHGEHHEEDHDHGTLVGSHA